MRELLCILSAVGVVIFAAACGSGDDASAPSYEDLMDQRYDKCMAAHGDFKNSPDLGWSCTLPIGGYAPKDAPAPRPSP